MVCRELLDETDTLLRFRIQWVTFFIENVTWQHSKLSCTQEIENNSLYICRADVCIIDSNIITNFINWSIY